MGAAAGGGQKQGVSAWKAPGAASGRGGNDAPMLRVRVKSPVQLTVFTFAAKWRSGAAANAGGKRAAKGAGRLLANAGRALRATRRRAAVRASILWWWSASV